MLICLDQRTGNGCNAENPNEAVRCHACGQNLRYALQLHDPGTLVDRYVVRSTLGYGGFGAVYAVDQRNNGAPLALKETFDAQSIAAFHREFTALSRLRHPHLPAYYAVFEHDDNGYLVMELVAGQSLQDVLDAAGGPLPEAQVLGYALQLCDVLSFLHQQQPPILHRDIKPANARLTPEGRIKLVDFGLLKQAGQRTRATIRGIGTPAYAPIEQYGGDADRTDVRSDVYSLAATLYHLLTGVEPPAATDRVASEKDPLRPPQQFVPTIAPTVQLALMQGLSIAQRDRPMTIEEFRQALFGAPSNRVSTPPSIPRSRATPTPAQTSAVQRLIVQMQGPYEAVRDLAWSPDNRQLVGPSGRNLFIWSVEHRFQRTFSPHQEAIMCADWSDDGRMIISGDWAGTIMLNRLDDDKPHVLGRHQRAVSRVRFSPDGSLAVSGGWDETIWLWDVASETAIGQLASPGGRVADIAWSRDGRRLAIAAYDGSIRLIDAASGQITRRIDAHSGAARCVAWAPDGRMLASGGDDGRLIIWSESDGAAIDRGDAHRGMTASLDWRADGRMLASGGMDRIVRLWGASLDGSLRTLFDLRGHAGCVWGLTFSPDARTLASAGGDWTVCLWRV